MKTTEVLDRKYLPAFGRIFTPSVLERLASKGYSEYLAEVCINSGLHDKISSSLTLGQFFDFIYRNLFKYYRNEYIYKNVIANKILLGRHSLNTARMLTEFRVGKNKADAVILNGSSTVYEIKSEFDSLNRLDKQIKTYFEIFDYINVITSPLQVEKIKSVLPNEVGIFVLTDKNTLSTIRSPSLNQENINPVLIFDSLRKSEYISIIQEYYGKVPDAPNTKIHEACKDLYCKIPKDLAHDLTIKSLKGRNFSPEMDSFSRRHLCHCRHMQ